MKTEDYDEQEPMLQQIRHSTTHPKYLHSNSTSHKWVFGAVAELVDNSVDAKATQFFVDVEDHPSNITDKLLIIRDNGLGYVRRDLFSAPLLSFPFCLFVVLLSCTSSHQHNSLWNLPSNTADNLC
jgi:hypothetical protein